MDCHNRDVVASFYAAIVFSLPLITVQNERGVKSRNYKFRRGTTAWTKESIRSLIVSEDVKVTSGAGKEQPGVEVRAVPIGAGPGGEEGMEVDP
jgi:20S proteasome subunit beta 2